MHTDNLEVSYMLLYYKRVYHNYLAAALYLTAVYSILEGQHWATYKQVGALQLYIVTTQRLLLN